jgi:hypothetical protein
VRISGERVQECACHVARTILPPGVQMVMATEYGKHKALTVASFGVICARRFGGEMQYLMVQRKDTIAFAEFVRGQFRVDEYDYVRSLIARIVVQSDVYNRDTTDDSSMQATRSCLSMSYSW